MIGGRVCALCGEMCVRYRAKCLCIMGEKCLFVIMGRSVCHRLCITAYGAKWLSIIGCSVCAIHSLRGTLLFDRLEGLSTSRG